MATTVGSDRSFTTGVMNVLNLVRHTQGDEALTIAAKQISTLVKTLLAERKEQLQDIGMGGHRFTPRHSLQTG